MAERLIPFELPDFCPPVCMDFSPYAIAHGLYADAELYEVILECKCKNAELCTRLYERLAAQKEDA